MAQHGVFVARVVVEVVALQRLHLGQPGVRQQRGGGRAQRRVERDGTRLPRRQQQRRAGRHARLDQALPGGARPAQFPGRGGQGRDQRAGRGQRGGGPGRAFIGRLRQRAALLAKSFQGFIDISPLKIQVMVTTANSRPLR